ETTPCAVTVARPGSLLVQRTTRPESVAPPASTATARSVADCPTVTDAGGAVNRMPATAAGAVVVTGGSGEGGSGFSAGVAAVPVGAAGDGSAGGASAANGTSPCAPASVSPPPHGRNHAAMPSSTATPPIIA